MPSKLSIFLAELKRRRVYRIAALYAAVGVAISLAVPDLFDALLLPVWSARLVIVLIALGFPIALILAWAYEVKPEEPRPAEPEDPRRAEPEEPKPAKPEGSPAEREGREPVSSAGDSAAGCPSGWCWREACVEPRRDSG